MNILDRLLPWRGKAASEEAGVVQVATSHSRYTRPSTSKRDLLGRYREWVYACASKNANAVAQSTLRLYAVTRPGDRAVRAPHRRISEKRMSHVAAKAPRRLAGGDVVEIVDHPFLDLLSTISGEADEYETWETTELHMELAGDAYWHVPRGPLGIPSSIRVLRPDLVRIVPADDGSVRGYLFGRRPSQVALMPDEVVHFRMPSPADPYYGCSPLQAAIMSDESYQRTLEHDAALAQNNAIPSLGIMYEGVLQGDEIRRIEADWNRALRGTAKTGKVKVYDNRFEVKEFQLSPAEANFLEGRKFTREEIAGVYGVPLSMLTTDSVNLANARVGEQSYARWTVSPRLRRIEDKINAALRLWYDEPRIFVAYDNPVPQDAEYELNRTVSLAAAGIVTRDEARQMQGLPPVGGETGAEWIPRREHNRDGEKSMGQKPLRNEHEFVLRESLNFEEFRRVNDDFGRGIDAVYGISPGGDAAIYAILFDALIWTFEHASHWIRENGYAPIESHTAQGPLAKERSDETQI